MTENIAANNSEEHLNEAENYVSRLTYLAYAGCIVAFIVLAAYAINFGGFPSKSHDKWGQFGDYVGGILNPTFSLLALLALLGTLGLQIRELRLSVKELKNSALALARQNETLRQQTFEGTFFQTLRLHNDIVSSLEVSERSMNYSSFEFTESSQKGRVCFSLFLDKLEVALKNHAATNEYDTFNAHYNIFYRRHQVSLGHYFRQLYNIIKFVKHSDVADKRFYTNLVRAQLSSAELKLIFYNCLSNWGNEKFKPLVEEFALLKTMPNEDLPGDEIVRLYNVNAFGGQYPSKDLM